jgi:hypothetical protein
MDEISMYEAIRPEAPADADAMRAAARHRLSTAIASEARTNGRVADRKATGRWFSGARGKTIIGVAGVAAAAAAATVIVLPTTSTTPSKTAPLAGSSAKPTMKAHTKPGSSLPSTVPTSTPPVTYSIGSAPTTLTASYVLDKAATAIGSRSATGANWPTEAYWHTEEQNTSDGCVVTDNFWMASNGNGVGEGDVPKPAQQGTKCGGSGGGAYEISSGGSLPIQIGQKNYTLAQLDALPTDPARLYPIVKADEQLPFSSTDPGAPKSGQSDLFQSIWNLVTSEPVPVALQKALYEVAAEIPGVTVEGTYTDSLGRTGTVLHIGLWTMAIDTSNGQVLAMSQAAGPPVTVCGTKGCSKQVPNAANSVYISAGWAPASSVPAVAVQNGAAGNASGNGGAGAAAPTAGAPATSAPSHQ